MVKKMVSELLSTKTVQYIRVNLFFTIFFILNIIIIEGNWVDDVI